MKKSEELKEREKDCRTREGKATRKRKFLRMLVECDGVVATACDKCGYSQQYIYNLKREDDEFSARIDEIRNGAIGKAEELMWKKMKEGDSQMIRFYLERRSKEYQEKKNVDVDVKNFKLSFGDGKKKK